MEHNAYHFDKKTLIGWFLILLVPVLSLSASRIFTGVDQQQVNRDLVIKHDIRIRDLEENQKMVIGIIDKLDAKIDKIESNGQKTHDNMLILMTKNKLRPVEIDGEN